jgi:catalase
VSDVRTAYHAVHAFDVVDSQGTHRLVRFTWEPVDGTLGETRTDLPDDYLHRELAARLQQGRVVFIRRMQISDPWDDPTDPTTVWPTVRRRVFMGTLVVNKLVADQEPGCERLSFNPNRLVPGLAISDDPILRARLGAYEASCRRRGGSGCPVAG